MFKSGLLYYYLLWSYIIPLSYTTPLVFEFML